ncbi:MAG: class I SAM-dependent methyltransferase [Minwuia sp.]|nr:class I SAM-dependent methyltransferase [Minwuia sp.]
MSRLDSAIDRLTAQRACLDWAAAAIAGLAGPVLELGLGNGRTYDHLRTLLPTRRIHVFERQVNAHLDCIPPDEDLFLGDFLETLPGAGRVIGAPAALVHADTGTGEKAASVALAAAIVPLLLPVLASGAVLVSDQPMQHPGLVPVPLPHGVKPGRYHIYRNS